MSRKIKVSLEARKPPATASDRALNESLGLWACWLSPLSSAPCLFIFTALLSAPALEVREISVRGVKELTEKDILQLANIQPRCNLLAVNTGCHWRGELPPILGQKFYVGRELPGRLVLDVRERKPIALVKQTGNFT